MNIIIQERKSQFNVSKYSIKVDGNLEYMGESILFQALPRLHLTIKETDHIECIIKKN